MYYQNLLILLWFYLKWSTAAITVTTVVVRIPKPKDIGLIFDLSVVNTQSEKKEMLEFRIRSDGTCCINLTHISMMKDASRVVGGNFGRLEPGAAEVVSLIWPTVSLYNRVGSCPIIITATNLQGVEVHQKQTLNFDTRFTTLDPDGHTLRKRAEYRDCQNWDKEYLKDCVPVNCEERYFGQRSFYNATSEHCEAVPRCDKPNEIYNFYSNECVNTEHFVTEADLQQIRDGKFVDECKDEKEEKKVENNTDDSKRPNIVVNIPAADMTDGSKTCNPHTKRAAAEAIESVDDDLRSFFNDHMPMDDIELGILDAMKEAAGATVAKTDAPAASNSGFLPYWLAGIMEGLLIVGVILFLQVFATVAVYVLICFVIFLIVTWISRRQLKRGITVACVLHSPAPSDVEEPLVTPSSLLSQR